MNTEKQIIAIAELDDFEIGCEMMGMEIPTPKYLTSRDAIVPVIEKQPHPIRVKVYHILTRTYGSYGVFLATAERFAEALLRATGKWKE